MNGIGYVSQVKDIRDPEPLLEELTCKQTPGEGKGKSRVGGRWDERGRGEVKREGVEGRGREVKRESGVA